MTLQRYSMGLDGYGYVEERDPEGEYVKYADLADRDTLRELIGLVRPQPVADENGDKRCLRLWPVAKCQHVSGHYGGCNTP